MLAERCRDFVERFFDGHASPAVGSGQRVSDYLCSLCPGMVVGISSSHQPRLRRHNERGDRGRTIMRKGEPSRPSGRRRSPRRGQRILRYYDSRSISKIPEMKTFLSIRLKKTMPTASGTIELFSRGVRILPNLNRIRSGRVRGPRFPSASVLFVARR